VLADGAGSGAICYGPAIEDWRTRDIAGQEVVLWCNGVARRRGTAADALDHPMVPLAWLANELSRTGIGLKAGQMISTGTLTGMLRPKAGETYVADFGPYGRVTASYVLGAAPDSSSTPFNRKSGCSTYTKPYLMEHVHRDACIRGCVDAAACSTRLVTWPR